MSSSGSILGNAVVRREDPGLLTGAERYYDDFTPEGTAYVTFVRSPVAHAAIESVDTSEAEAADGVLAVYTGHNIGLPATAGFPMLPQFERPQIVSDRVLFVGDIVAAVVTETREQGTDAAEMVFVDYNPLPANADPEKALAEGAEVLWPDNETGNLAFHTELGEDDGLAEAAHVAEVKMESQRLAAVPMEPNGILVEPGTPEGGMTVTFPSQAPIGLKDGFAGLFGLDGDNVRLIAPAVGGGFGAKTGLYPEYLVAAKAALELGRPVKWTESRSEDMVSLVQGRGHILTAKMGFDGDGRITGLNLHCLADSGAYPAIGSFLPILTQTMAQGVYQIPKVKFSGDAVVTNTTQIAAYRGAGRPEATQILERVLDVGADELGIDPAEIRRRNFIGADQFPYATVTGATTTPASTRRALDAALEASGYSDLRADQAARGIRATPSCWASACRLRGDHRPPRPAHRVRPGGRAERRHRRGAGGHQLPRPGSRDGLLDDRQRSVGRAHGEHQAHPIRHRRDTPGHGHARLPLASDRGQRRLPRPARRCWPRPRSWPPSSSRPAPMTSWWARAACTWPACPPRPHRGPIWPLPPTAG